MANVQVPAVPEVSTDDQPVLSKPSVKSVMRPPQEAVKFFPVTLADVMVTDVLAGLKVQPLFVGVTV